jgi:hypothetical protein
MSLSEDIRNAARAGLSIAAIEVKTGASRQTISGVIYRMNNPRVTKPPRARKTSFVRIDVSKVHPSLVKEAERRGFSTTSFVTRLLKAIAKDKIFNAVLDERAE